MYKVAIFEDEPLAVKKLKRLLIEIEPNLDVIATLTSNQEITEFLADDPDVDVIFSDIELTDGPVFSCFQQTMPTCPVIFVTAYNQFMQNAFDSSGIAYILKPYNKAKLNAAWQKLSLFSNKVHQAKGGIEQATGNLDELKGLINKLEHHGNFVEKFAIKSANCIHFLQAEDITHIQADGGVISAFDCDGKRHYLPFNSLQKLEQQLDSRAFFRINRSEYVNQKYIEKLERFAKNTLSIRILGSDSILTTSQSRTAAFAKWLGL